MAPPQRMTNHPTRWVIHKWSRSPHTVSYNGPSCQHAGVIGGRVYDDKEEAEVDAKKLSQVNPVGFCVSPQPETT